MNHAMKERACRRRVYRACVHAATAMGAVLLLLCVAIHPLRAQSGPVAWSVASVDSMARTSRFEFQAAAWLMGLGGTVRPSKVAQTATLDASSHRVWELGESSGYASMLYRRDRFVLAGDLSGFESTDAGRLATGEAAVVVQRLHSLTVTPGVALVGGERGSFAVFGGVRIWRMSNSVGVPSLAVEDRARTSYYDVVLASRLERRWPKGITTAVYADAGGFHVASDLTWQGVGTLAVRASDSWSLIAGYRHLSVDYRGDNKRVSLAMFGPTLGASLSF